MDSESQQPHKQHRRKRKDQESRDFRCICDKSYLSYAAAYTHVKKKHNGEKQYLDNIEKPKRDKEQRGRPKQKKLFSISIETKKLSIIEETILQIYESMNLQKIILEGNQQTKFEELITMYQELKKEVGQPGLSLFVDGQQYGVKGDTLNEFIEGINKHFIPRIACRVIWFLNFVLADQFNAARDLIDINMENVRKKYHRESFVCKKIWNGKDSISSCIIDALEKYLKTNDKNTESSEINNDI